MRSIRSSKTSRIASSPRSTGRKAYEAEGILVQSGPLHWWWAARTSKARRPLALWRKWAAEEVGEFRLRDWLISASAIGETPFPHLLPKLSADWCRLPEEDLPVRLPKDIDLSAAETLGHPCRFRRLHARSAAARLKRETGHHGHLHVLELVLPALHRPPQHRAALRPEKPNRWMPVPISTSAASSTPSCTCSYSRFFTKVLRDMGMLDFDEPFKNLLCQGMVLDSHGEVMSKSKGNVSCRPKR